MTLSDFYWSVVRIPPRSYGRHELNWFDPPEVESTNGLPLRAFDSEEAAFEWRDQLEREARAGAPIGLFIDSLLPESLDVLLNAVADCGEPGPDLTPAGRPVLPVRTVQPNGSVRIRYSPELHEFSEKAAVIVREWGRTIRPETNAKLWDELFPENYFYAVVDVPVEE